MKRYITLFLLFSASAYGMESSTIPVATPAPQPSRFASMIETSRGYLAKFMADERVKSTISYASTQTEDTRTYIKQNPGKASVFCFGAAAIAYLAIKTIKAIKHSAHKAIKRHQLNHAFFCCCCGTGMDSETKFIDEELAKRDGKDDSFYCVKCHSHIVRHVNQSIEIKRQLARDLA
jgi:hypothetical protein